MRGRFIWPIAILIGILSVGTMGYWLVGGRQHSLLDTLYMTVITIATIGYGEVIDLAENPAGRVFTMVIAVLGIGLMSYIMVNYTALLVEGELTQSFRRRRMEKRAGRFEGHYIVCGVGEVGSHIVDELCATNRPFVIVDSDRNNINKVVERFRDAVFIEGDATDGGTLQKAGVETARGLFAVVADDNHNLVVTFTAKQLNASVRVVARCKDMRNSDKLRRAGADAVVAPGFIGGLRMASEMVRPTAVTFLDMMLRDRELSLRVEEVPVPPSFVGKPIATLNLSRFPNVLLLAVRTRGDWTYNPPDDYVIQPDNTLVFMTTPQERQELEAILDD